MRPLRLSTPTLLISFLFLVLSFGFSAGQAANGQTMDKTSRISFHPSLIPSILAGKKTATIRANHRDYYQLGEGVATARDGSSIPIIIEEVFLTHYLWREDAITSEILSRENMRDTSETGFHQLYQALLTYYPDFKIGSPTTVIFFRLAQ